MPDDTRDTQNPWELTGLSRRGMLGGIAAATAALLIEDLAWAQQAQAEPLWRHPFTTRGNITSGFGMRFDPTDGVWKMHFGTDYNPPGLGTPIYSVASGTTEVGYNGAGFGNYVRIDHGGGWTSLYGHMRDAPLVSQGQVVGISHQVGVLGSTGDSTGAHLHIEIALNGTRLDPEDYIHNAPLADPSSQPTETIKENDNVGVIYFANPGPAYTTVASTTTYGASHPGGTVVSVLSMWFQECPGAPIFPLSGGGPYNSTPVWEEYEGFGAQRTPTTKCYTVTPAKMGALIQYRGLTTRPVGNFV